MTQNPAEIRRQAARLDARGEFEWARWLRIKAAEIEHDFTPDDAPLRHSPLVLPLDVPQNRGMDGKRRHAA